MASPGAAIKMWMKIGGDSRSGVLFFCALVSRSGLWGPGGVTFSLLSLPTNGDLFDSTGAPLTCTQTDPRSPNVCVTPILLSNANLTYVPDAAYNGPDGFEFEANDGNVVSNAVVSILVGSPPAASCDSEAGLCDDGRDPQ